VLPTFRYDTLIAKRTSGLFVGVGGFILFDLIRDRLYKKKKKKTDLDRAEASNILKGSENSKKVMKHNFEGFYCKLKC
jgi:hypothetical protein